MTGERSGLAELLRQICLTAAEIFQFLNISAAVVLAPQAGLEPTALRLTGECSTVELLRNMSGGADPDRTGDLILAKDALSLLSYSPKIFAYILECRMLSHIPGTLFFLFRVG